MARDTASIFLGNVDLTTSEHDLEDFLADALAPTRVVSVGVPKGSGGHGTGVAFLELELDADLDAVLVQLDGMPFRGRVLRARRAVAGAIRSRPGWNAPPQGHVFLGNVNYLATEAALAAHVREVAGVAVTVTLPKDPVTLKGRGYAFVELRDAADAERIIGLLDGVVFQERPLNARPANAKARHR